ncbi:hypothetical protein MKY41_17875 [Sporosarcina sp. FSL W7-1349]|uniref:hypothetical protein n=1 Tax=Sporosarcina sp. FSL W7-1349 TaxID=2921561 RepID=UPI0030FAD890
MSELLEIDQEQVERLEDRDFIKWMIEELSSEELAMLLFVTKTEKNVKKLVKLPIPFLQNKVLAKAVRSKLRSMELIPPFPFYIEKMGEKEIESKDEIMEVVQEENCDARKAALIFYLQNHYEEAWEYYETRDEEETAAKEADVVEKESEPEKPSEKQVVSAKIENKLQSKIEKLTIEKEELIARNNQLKQEVKEKNTEYIKDLNQARQALAEEKKLVTELEEQLTKFKSDIEKLRAENAALRVENSNAVEQANLPPRAKEKLAMIGHPKNSRILENEAFHITVFELDELQNFIEEADQYAYIFYLSYVIDEVVYEEMVPETIRENIKRIESFMQLKKVMGEITYV